MKLYFAAPLFSESERMYNLVITERIEDQGVEVFLPQRDGSEEDTSELTISRLQAEIYESDKEEVYDCDIFFILLDGRVPDEGACVELGLAVAHAEMSNRKRYYIGMKTDQRVTFPEVDLNPMIKEALDYLVESDEDLLDLLTTFSSKDFE